MQPRKMGCASSIFQPPTVDTMIRIQQGMTAEKRQGRSASLQERFDADLQRQLAAASTQACKTTAPQSPSDSIGYQTLRNSKNSGSTSSRAPSAKSMSYDVETPQGGKVMHDLDLLRRLPKHMSQKWVKGRHSQSMGDLNLWHGGTELVSETSPFDVENIPGGETKGAHERGVMRALPKHVSQKWLKGSHSQSMMEINRSIVEERRLSLISEVKKIPRRHSEQSDPMISIERILGGNDELFDDEKQDISPMKVEQGMQLRMQSLQHSSAKCVLTPPSSKDTLWTAQERVLIDKINPKVNPYATIARMEPNKKSTLSPSVVDGQVSNSWQQQQTGAQNWPGSV